MWKKLGLLFLLVFVIIQLTPFYIAMTVSAKPRTDLSSRWLPPQEGVYWENYERAIERGNVLTAIKNSVIITAVSTLLCLPAWLHGWISIGAHQVPLEQGGHACHSGGDYDSPFKHTGAPLHHDEQAQCGQHLLGNDLYYGHRAIAIKHLPLCQFYFHIAHFFRRSGRH